MSSNLPRLHAQWLMLALAGNTISCYLGFEAFRALFQQMKPGMYGRLRLAHLYFTAQLMKHLPGRIWGVAYQSTTGDRVSLTEWISVTVGYMALTTGFAVWVAATVLGFMLAACWGLLALIVGVTVYVVAWHRRPLSLFLALLRKLPVQAAARLSDALMPLVDTETKFKLRLLMLFGANWLIYLVSWVGYGLAWPGLNAADGIQLCAMYTLAWLVGYLSLVSPSGIGVRELIFVMLAHRFPADAVAGLAVLGRVTLLLTDALLGAIFSPFSPARISTTSSRERW
ncbi:MAG: hypothetical protein ACTHMK_07370 [Dyella sp.]|uniref:hypothetical protein n=1 Tax=Dyella sp. TaxID=1869338 RepID=UPI003F7D237B